MLFKSFVSAAIVASVLAQPLQHQHHEHQHEKKDIKYVTQTNIVTAGKAAATGSPTTLQTVATSGSTGTGSSGSSGSSSSGSDSSSSGSDSSSSGSAGVAGSSGARGITYTPYSDDGGCKSSSQIKKEVGQLDGYDVIRLYGVDCDQVSAVLSAKSKSQKIFAGIFDVANIESGVKTLASAVKSSGSWDDIDTVSIGNELVNSGQADASQIKKYVESGRSSLKDAGFSGKVVSVDTFIAVYNNPDLCKYSDYIAVNAHAFFDGGYSAQDAGKWVLNQIEGLSSTCGGDKKVLITESGWPSSGDTNGKAVPSKSNQKDAIKSIKKECGDDVLLFTAFNDNWKASGAFNAEKSYGILSN